MNFIEIIDNYKYQDKDCVLAQSLRLIACEVANKMSFHSTNPEGFVEG
jgi:hypothetical protein